MRLFVLYDRAVKIGLSGRNGGGLVLEKMIRKYYDEIFLYCFHRVGNRAAAEDLCQDTFVSFIEHYAEYRHIGRTKNYLYTIAGNKCKDYYRKNKPIPVEEFPEQGTGECLEELVVMRQMVSGLPDELREAVILRYFQNLKYQDIAMILGISSSVAKYRVKKAVERLCEMEGGTDEVKRERR